MASIVLLNSEKLNSQVQINVNFQPDKFISIELNNKTKNAYKVFLEVDITMKDNQISKIISAEFFIASGVMTLDGNEVGLNISEQIKFSGCQDISFIVKQKFGPDLGFLNVEV